MLTLAYRGFPPQLVALKQQISDYYQSLPKEVRAAHGTAEPGSCMDISQSTAHCCSNISTVNI